MLNDEYTQVLMSYGCKILRSNEDRIWFYSPYMEDSTFTAFYTLGTCTLEIYLPDCLMDKFSKAGYHRYVSQRELFVKSFLSFGEMLSDLVSLDVLIDGWNIKG